jgi:hypothetical protein
MQFAPVTYECIATGHLSELVILSSARAAGAEGGNEFVQHNGVENSFGPRAVSIASVDYRQSSSSFQLAGNPIASTVATPSQVGKASINVFRDSFHP